MELKTGLGGQSAPGQTSEIKIHLFATHPIAGELEIIDGNGLTRLPVQLDEQREKTLWLPVSPGPLIPVKVRLITEQRVVADNMLVFEHSPSPLIIISSTIPVSETLNMHHQPVGITPVILSATGFPHIAQAYSGVDAIVINPQTLSSLSQDQYHALAYHLSRCSIMLLSGTNQTVLERLRNIAGCNGRFVQSYENLSQVTPMLLKLIAKRHPKTPAPEELMPLRQTPFQQQMITSISLYLGGYIFFFTLATWLMKKTQYLLLLPALVAAAGLMVWIGEGSHHLISWAETESGDSHNNISSLLLLGGDRLGENSITLGTDTRLSNFLDEAQHPSIRYLQDVGQRELSGFTYLLSPQAYHLTSTARRLPQFLLTTKEGQPEVIFLGEQSPAETRLLWRGHSYSVPVLARDDRWQPDKMLGHEPTSHAERLLNRHLAFENPALLLPYTPDLAEVGDNAIQTTGWLVIRHNPEQNNNGLML